MLRDAHGIEDGRGGIGGKDAGNLGNLLPGYAGNLFDAAELAGTTALWNTYMPKLENDRIVREKSQVVCGCMDVTSHDIEDAVLGLVEFLYDR